MSGSVVWGLAVVVFAGMLQGSFTAPMKRMSAWRWENSWLLFALSGLIIFPWIITFATVPNVLVVYSGPSTSTFIKVVSFGLLWGAGATLLGLGISRGGSALGFFLTLCTRSSFVSLCPLRVAVRIWRVTVRGGLVSNFLYWVWLLNKTRAWSGFREGNPSASWPLGISTGLLWFGGTVLYGMGAASLGSLGNIVGWPIFMTLDIIVGVFWGAVAGEVKGARHPALGCTCTRIVTLLLPIPLIPPVHTT